MIFQHSLPVSTTGRGMFELTSEIRDIVRQPGITTGICQAFLYHTSASLIITENADPDVRYDLEGYIRRLVIDGDPEFRHRLEGDDDMAAHVRSVLTQTDISLPITNAALALGTWQGVYLWEHRYQAHRRNLTITVSGE